MLLVYEYQGKLKTFVVELETHFNARFEEKAENENKEKTME